MITSFKNPYKIISDNQLKNFEDALMRWYLSEAKEDDVIPDARKLTLEYQNIYFDELISSMICSLAEQYEAEGMADMSEQLLQNYYEEPFEYDDDIESDAYTFFNNRRIFHRYSIATDYYWYGDTYYNVDDYIEHSPLQEVW